MEVDYIVIGAGSAGCAVAGKLAEGGKHSVLLVEAGGENRSPLVEMPRGWVRLWQNPKHFWLFPVEAQTGRPAGEQWAYGKGLGGSSAVNGTLYSRGQPADFDPWQEHGPEWSWAQMERVYREMEDFRGPAPHPSRGKGGPLQITELDGSRFKPVFDAVFKAAAAMGLPYQPDINAPGQSGIGYSQVTINARGRRSTAYGAFLKSLHPLSNLQIVTEAVTQRILLRDGRAVGVEVEQGGRRLIYTARREVILCAGVLNSPKILQLSGLGPAALLQRQGIKVAIDLPAVGDNLREQVMLTRSYRLHGAAGLNREFRGWRLWRNLLEYYLFGRGVMSYAASELTAFLPFGSDPSWPRVQMSISPYSFSAQSGEKAEPGRGAPDPFPGISITCMFLRPRSTGRLSLQSTDARAAPRIEANWLSDPQDRTDVAGLFRYMDRLMRRPEFGGLVGEETFPKDGATTDAEILASVMQNFGCGLHGTGTCRMGRDPGTSVVDSRARVHGVTNLRVADCSIMPTLISGGTNGPAMAVGRRVAELILEDATPS